MAFVRTDRYVSAYDQTLVYLGLGDNEQAFAWLVKPTIEPESAQQHNGSIIIRNHDYGAS